jgi:uncharacterized protein (DUF427 family)
MLVQSQTQKFMFDHPRKVEPTPRHVRAKFGSEFIADSRNALL